MDLAKLKAGLKKDFISSSSSEDEKEEAKGTIHIPHPNLQGYVLTFRRAATSPLLLRATEQEANNGTLRLGHLREY